MAHHSTTIHQKTCQKPTSFMAGLKNKNKWSRKNVLESLERMMEKFGRIAISIHFQETGTMVGKGHAMVVVRPGSLRETTQVLEMCLEAGVAIVPQGAGRLCHPTNSWNLWMEVLNLIGPNRVWWYGSGMAHDSWHDLLVDVFIDLEAPPGRVYLSIFILVCFGTLGGSFQAEVPKQQSLVDRSQDLVIDPWLWLAPKGCRRFYQLVMMRNRSCALQVLAFSAYRRLWTLDLPWTGLRTSRYSSRAATVTAQRL